MRKINSNQKKEGLIFLGLLLLSIALMIGGGYASAVKRGLLIWVGSVLPSLFPYAFISACLSKMTVTGKLSNKLTPLTKRFFNTGGVTAYAFTVSLIAGYPIGSKTVSDLKKGGLISDSESVRASVFCSTSSPMFLLSTVGVIAFNSPKFGALLLLSHVISCFLTGVMFSFYKRKDKPTKNTFNPKKIDNLFYESVFSAINSSLFIGGVIVLFTLLIEILLSLKILSLPIFIGEKVLGDYNLSCGLTFGILECTSGIIALKNGGITFLTLPLCGFLCGFGGFCILMQSVCYLKNANIKTAPFLVAKLFQGGFNFCICLILNLFLF